MSRWGRAGGNNSPERPFTKAEEAGGASGKFQTWTRGGVTSRPKPCWIGNNPCETRRPTDGAPKFVQSYGSWKNRFKIFRVNRMAVRPQLPPSEASHRATTYASPNKKKFPHRARRQASSRVSNAVRSEAEARGRPPCRVHAWRVIARGLEAGTACGSCRKEPPPGTNWEKMNAGSRKQGVRGEELPPARRGAALDAGGPAADCGGVWGKTATGCGFKQQGIYGLLW